MQKLEIAKLWTCDHGAKNFRSCSFHFTTFMTISLYVTLANTLLIIWFFFRICICVYCKSIGSHGFGFVIGFIPFFFYFTEASHTQSLFIIKWMHHHAIDRLNPKVCLMAVLNKKFRFWSMKAEIFFDKIWFGFHYVSVKSSGRSFQIFFYLIKKPER